MNNKMNIISKSFLRGEWNKKIGIEADSLGIEKYLIFKRKNIF